MWLIIGVIIFLITVYVHKHTYKYASYDRKTGNYEVDKEDKFPFPIWLLILIFAISFIPILNIILFIVGLIAYIIELSSEDVYFVPTGVIKKILDFLNKKV